MEDKYFKCWKCGGCISKTKDSLCTNEVTYRISGICGGSFTKELTEEEITKWDEIIKIKISNE